MPAWHHAAMAYEIELKFRIPAARVAAVRRAVNTLSARQIRLAARYVDTPGQDLAAARSALRLRLEGQTWVQTLKAEGNSPLQRHEHEVVLPAGAEPLLDLARHDGSAAGAALRRVLAGAADATLVERYATDVLRTQRLLRHQGALIELALDEGALLADNGARRLPVLELEMELKRGEPAALLDLAGRWAQRFGLLLDVRSKSERGQTLANAAADDPHPGLCAPVKARPLRLPADVGLAQALAAMLANPLQQVLANASSLCDGPAAPEHLHQLRVGLRRLRTVLRLYGPLAPQWPAAWSQQLAGLFAALGEARDLDAMAQDLWPALRAAGAPLVEPAGDGAPPASGAHPAAGRRGAPPAAAGEPVWVQLLRAADTQALWLALLGASLPGGSVGPVSPSSLAAPPEAVGPGDHAASAPEWPTDQALAAPLHRLWRQIRHDSRRFASLDDAARHRLRRRIKRLRYALELAASLWPARKVRALARSLAKAQQPLGLFNDTVVALAHYRAWVDQDARAWFAVGWLQARHDALLAPCAEALARLAQAKPAWPAPAKPRG